VRSWSTLERVLHHDLSPIKATRSAYTVLSRCHPPSHTSTPPWPCSNHQEMLLRLKATATLPINLPMPPESHRLAALPPSCLCTAIPPLSRPRVSSRITRYRQRTRSAPAISSQVSPVRPCRSLPLYHSPATPRPPLNPHPQRSRANPAVHPVPITLHRRWPRPPLHHRRTAILMAKALPRVAVQVVRRVNPPAERPACRPAYRATRSSCHPVLNLQGGKGVGAGAQMSRPRPPRARRHLSIPIKAKRNPTNSP